MSLPSLETIADPKLYPEHQLHTAALIAVALNAHRLVLCEPPARPRFPHQGPGGTMRRDA